MSLLSIIQDVTARVGLPPPTQVIGSSDNQIRMLLSLAQEEGKELAQRHSWQALTFEHTFTTTATETQTGALPAGYGRMIEGSVYNRTQKRPVVGPLTPQRWQQIKSTLSVSIWSAFRLRGNVWMMSPTPAADDTIYYEYVSKYWCGGASATEPTQDAWAADTDQGFLSEELMGLGIRWRFLKARGLDYAEPFRLYEEQYMRIAGADGGNRIIDLSPDNIGAGWFDPYIQDGSWPIN